LPTDVSRHVTEDSTFPKGEDTEGESLH